VYAVSLKSAVCSRIMLSTSSVAAVVLRIRTMGFGNLAVLFGQCDSCVGMTHFPQPNPTHRASRVKLATTPVLVKLGDGKQAKGNIHVVSVNGGLLQLARGLSEGDFVEVAFQTQSGNIQGMAEMLHPVGKGQGSVFQAFRFVAIEDDAHQALRMAIESAGDRTFLGLTARRF